MAIEVFNRNECKFLIDEEINEQFQTRLLQYMELDEYNMERQFYTISNLYYDTKDNQLIRNSLSRPAYKEKLRLRSYGVPKEDEKVYLEIKKKVCGVVNKRRTKLSLKEAYEFTKTGEKPQLKNYMNKQVLNEIEYILKIHDLEPKLYLAYDRKAFFGKENKDLRITFDTNIRTRRYDLTLESGDYGENLLESSKLLMEVKAEKNLPHWLAKMLSEYKVYKRSFSKYGNEYEKQILKSRVLEGDKKVCLNQYSVQPQALQQLAPQYL